MTRLAKSIFGIVATIVLSAVLADSAEAGTGTWTGSGNTWENTSGNWSWTGGGWPVYPGDNDRNDTAVFDVSTTGSVSPVVGGYLRDLTVLFTGTGTTSFTITGSGSLGIKDTGGIWVDSSVTTDQKFEITVRPEINKFVPGWEGNTWAAGLATFANNGSGILEFAGIQPDGHNGDAEVVFDGSGAIKVGQLDDLDANRILSVKKEGTGTLTITGAGTYSGGTIVNGGTLLVNNTTGSGTGTGNVTVNSGATLGGSGTIGGATTIAGGGFLAPGASIDTLTIDNLLDISGAVGGPAGSMLFELGPNPSGDMVVLTGGNQLTIGSGLLEWDDFLFTDLGATAGDYTLFDTEVLIDGSLGSSLTGTVGTLDGTLSLGDGGNDLVLTLESAAVPEPSTFVIASLLGLLGLALFGGRKRK